ncbi:MAG: hypothetical protein OQJ89_16765, partial [Kangiellaceae bacterium]|nr:hypothetical protein [Kangiellaceae bacterium]
SAGVRMPVSGKTAKGIKEVFGIGTGSNIHQMAHRKVVLATITTAKSNPKVDSKAPKIRLNKGVSQRRVFFKFFI